MRILLVHNTYQRPNGEDVVFKQERELLERAGHQVLTYCLSNSEIADYSALKRLALLGRMVWARDSRREIASILRSKRPDLVHVHNTFLMVSPSIYSACKGARVPVVQTLHNYRLLCPAADLFRSGGVCEECPEHSLWRGVMYGCYRDSRAQTSAVALMLTAHRWLGTWTRLVDCFVALTELSRQKFIRGGIPAEKIAVKPNFVHPDPGVRHGAGDYALFVGQLTEKKGLRTLLAAWERLKNCVPLQIVGDGPLRPELEKQASSLAPSDGRAGKPAAPSVSFLGHVSHDRVTSLMKLARFLLVPSIWREPFGLINVEAFACGVPVVAARTGAMEEIVADGRTGLHFTPGDAEDLAAKVDWAWTNPEEMDTMGRAARAEYETKYTAERNYEKLMEIYRGVLGDSSSSESSRQ